MTSDVPELDAAAREDAALKIQRAWRKSKGKPKVLNAEDRWQDAAVHAKLQTLRDDAEEGKNDPVGRWKRAAFLASRLHANGSESMPTTGQEWRAPEHEKILETQHWLELIDSKHRYGSNLKYFYRRWLEEDTEENFFKWLDRGGGKDLSLPDCSREQLEKERIMYAGYMQIYLSPEQRLNYKVKIDELGLLRWERNNELVDTTSGRWQDAGDGTGIVPYDVVRGDEPPVVHRTSFEISPSRSSRSSVVSAGSQDSQNATHYVETTRKRNSVQRWIRSHLTVKGWTELLLRKTVRRNTWIYVADRHFNLYIGIKNTGTFQHSSFLAGGLVISAGLISVHKGLIHKLSPLSGHYRTKIHVSKPYLFVEATAYRLTRICQNFRNFLKGLEERHVDLHRAEISRAEIALWGIERIKKFEKKKSDVEQRGKETIKSVISGLTPSASRPIQEDDSQWRRDILMGRKKAAGLKDAAIRAVSSMTTGNAEDRLIGDVHARDSSVTKQGTEKDEGMHSVA